MQIYSIEKSNEYKDVFTSQTQKHQMLYIILLATVKAFLHTLTTICIDVYEHILITDGYNEMIKLQLIGEEKRRLHTFIVMSKNIGQMASNILKGLVLLTNVYDIVSMVQKRYLLGLVMCVYIYISSFGTWIKNYYNKKRVPANAKQLQFITDSCNMHTTVLINHSKNFIERKFFNSPEYDLHYICTNEAIELLLNFLFTSLEIFDVFKIKKSDFKYEFNQSIVFKNGLDSVRSLISDTYLHYEMIPDNFCSNKNETKIKQMKLQMFNEIKEIGGGNDLRTSVSILNPELYMFNKSIGQNFNWNRRTFQNNVMMKHHIFQREFYMFLVNFLEISDLENIFRIKADRLSYGQQKVVAIFRNLLSGDKVHVLINPFDKLDEEHHSKLLKIFENYNIKILDVDQFN